MIGHALNVCVCARMCVYVCECVTDTLTFKVSAYLATLDCSSWPDRSIFVMLWPESMEVFIDDG